MRSSLAAVVISLSCASQAFAIGQVWYDAVAVVGEASVWNSGQGQMLVLDCDTDVLGPCGWDITVRYELFDGGATGWALDLFGPVAGFAVTNQAAPAHALNGNAPGNAGAPGANPGELLLNASGGNVSVWLDNVGLSW